MESPPLPLDRLPAGRGPRAALPLVGALVAAAAGVAWLGGTFLPGAGDGRGRDAGAIVPAAPPTRAGSTDREEPFPQGPEPDPAAAEGGAIEGAPGLVLLASAEPPRPGPGEPFRLVAVLANRGTRPVSLFLPDYFASGEVFPDWRIRGSDGAEFVPAEGEGAQTAWKEGVVGEIARLGPGSWRTFATDVERVVPAGEGGGSRGTVRLPPGDWTVSCTCSRASRSVPWSASFDSPDVEREVEGLWTGRLDAEPFTLRILPGGPPSLVLSAPGPLVPGEAGPVEIAIVNSGLEPADLRGRLVLLSLRIGRLPVRVASLAPGDPCLPAPEGSSTALRVDASSTLRLRAEFARLPGDWVAGPGVLILQAVFEPEDESGALSSNRLRLPVLGYPDAGARGLRLRLLPGGRGSFTADLRNEGEGALRVPRGSSWPARLFLEVRRPAGGGDESLIPTVLPDGRPGNSSQVVRWDLTGGGPRDLGPGDFVELAPGESMAATADLLSDAAPRIPQGPYEVRAIWRSPENGVRAGLEPGSAVAGEVSTEWLPFDLPAR